jgi:hypothetical protein
VEPVKTGGLEVRDISIHIINELSDDILLNVAYGNDSSLVTARDLGIMHARLPMCIKCAREGLL